MLSFIFNKDLLFQAKKHIKNKGLKKSINFQASWFFYGTCPSRAISIRFGQADFWRHLPEGAVPKKKFSTPVWVSFDQSTWNFTGGYIISRHNWGLILGSVGLYCKIFANLLKLEVLKYIVMRSSHQHPNARSFNRRYNAIVAWKPGFMALPCFLFCEWTVSASNIIWYCCSHCSVLTYWTRNLPSSSS